MAPWSSLAHSLSSSLHLPSFTTHTGDDDVVQPFSAPTTVQDASTTTATEEQAGDAALPTTPPNHRDRQSPRRLSASGSQIMEGVLSAHPHFSVFRKSSSQQSLDQLVTAGADSPLAHAGDDAEEMERLASPARDERVNSRVLSPTHDQQQGNSSNTSSEWHLSMGSDDMHSLQWGDGSSNAIALSPEQPSRRARSTSQDEHSAVRLVDTSLDSPPSFRTSSSRPSSNPNRQSLSRSTGPSTRVQFSPLSLAPSPLLGLPPLPPPPPSLLSALDSLEDDSPTHRPNSALKKTILKMPRTPGTGQSVRFTASTAVRTEESPTVAVGGTEAEDYSTDQSGEASTSGHGVEAPEGNSFDEENSSLSLSTSQSFGGANTTEGNSTHLVASFLSKLQAAIPSPDVSLVTVSADVEVEEAVGNPRFALTSPGGGEGEALKGLGVALAAVAGGGSRNLFDESNPFVGQSMSMRSMEITREEVGREEEEEEEEDGEESEVNVVNMDVIIDAAEEQQPQLVDEEEQEDNSMIDHFPSPAPTPQRATVDSPTAIDSPGASFRTSCTSSASPSAPSPTVTLSNHAPTTPPRAASSSSPAIAASPSLWGEANESLASSGGEPSFSTPNRSSTSTSAASSKRGASSAFYKQFLQKRARESAVAADELGRIVSREQGTEPVELVEEVQHVEQQEWERSVYGTPGDGEKSVLEPAPTEDVSVYFSPTPLDRRVYDQERERYLEEDEEVSIVEGEEGESFDADELRPSMEKQPVYSSSLQEIYLEQDEGGRNVLSPIAEASEPNTTINSLSPWTNPPSSDPRAPPPPRLSFSSFLPPHTSTASPAPTPARAPPTPSNQRTLTLYHSTPDSRIPRLSQRRPAPSPSVNHFALSASSTSATTVATADLQLIQSLLSAQSDQAGNASTQKFLLSSLVSNLRDEVERKDLMIVNLRKQKEEVEQAWRETLGEVEEWERRGGPGAERGGEQVEQERVKLEALEEVVERLTDELEKRTKVDRAQRRVREEESEALRRELGRVKTEVRDGEIRLRHAKIGQAEAEELGNAAREEARTAVEEKETLVREKEEARRRTREEALERERVIAMLREEVAVMAAARSGGEEKERDEEVERRVEQARSDVRQEVELVREQLDECEATIVTLREENRTLHSSLASLTANSTQQRQALDLALIDARSDLARLQEDLTSTQRAKSAVDEELATTQERLEAIEVELDRLGDEARLKDDKLALQTSAWEEHQAGMARLMESVSKMEEEGQVKTLEVAQLKEELRQAKEEAETLLEDRDRRLTESETALSSRIAKNEALVEGCNRLKETVNTLRRGSADREVKYARLKKIKAEQDEDIFGLNIALEAKQQEASAWKRQLASARLIAATPAPVRSRSALSSFNSSIADPNPAPSSGKTVIATNMTKNRQRERPLSTELAADTPSRSSRLVRKPSLGFGSTARREVIESAPTPARRRSGSSSSVERMAASKENQRPMMRRRESAEEAPRVARVMLPA